MADTENTLDSYGAELWYKQTGGSWVRVDNLLEVNPPEEEVEVFENSHLNSPDYTKSYKGGWTEPGTSSIRAHMLPDQVVALKALRGTKLEWKLAVPEDALNETYSGDVLLTTWSGVLTKVSQGALALGGDPVESSVEIKNSGKSVTSVVSGPVSSSLEHA